MSRYRRRADLAARGQEAQEEEEEEEDEREPVLENLEDRKGHSLADWVTMESPRREIYRRFKLFLKTFVDNRGNNVHAEKIKHMCQTNGESLVIRYNCGQHPSPASPSLVHAVVLSVAAL